MKTAILIDGGFFLKRYPIVFRNGGSHTPAVKVKNMYTMCMRHLAKNRRTTKDLYRILFYDCPPYEGTAQNPISQQQIHYANSPLAQERNELFTLIKKQRKVALRLGKVAADRCWVINPKKTKKLLNGQLTVDQLEENDVKYSLRQKGVDIKIGLDIASLALKEKVDQIVLIAGDSDFVPAAKVARREGVDFILDPMWNNIREDLDEHIDGLQSTVENPSRHMPDDKYPYII